MVPDEPVGRLIVIALDPLFVNIETDAMDSAPGPPPTVSVALLVARKVTIVLMDNCNLPMVCVGTFVAVVMLPLLNCKMSSVAGVVRVGVQLAAVCQFSAPVGFHV